MKYSGGGRSQGVAVLLSIMEAHIFQYQFMYVVLLQKSFACFTTQNNHGHTSY